MEEQEYKRPDNEQEWLQMIVDSGSTDGWSLIGKLEWPNLQYTDGSGKEYEYNEMPTDMFGSTDYLWMKMELWDTWSQEENPEDRKVIGKHRRYSWCIGIPPNGNVTYRYTPWTVMEILQYLADRGTVCIGITQHSGAVMWRVPDKVRLQGMTEWIHSHAPAHTP